MSKTAVEHYLEAKNIAYQSYRFNAVPVEQTTIPIVKTLVLTGDKSGATIALIPFDQRLDYKKLAKVSGNRKIGLPPIEKVLEMTGYPHGANTPIGIFSQHPEYPIFFDQTITTYEKIIVSAGELEKAVIIATTDLIQLIQPTVGDLLK